MKKLILSFALFVTFNLLHGQVQNFLSSTAEYYKFQGTPGYSSFGISAEQMFGKHVGFELNVSGGKDNFQSGVGLFALPIMGLASSSFWQDMEEGKFSFTPLVLMTILSIASLERVTYHIQLAPDVQLIPYASLCRIRYMYDNARYKENWFSSWSVGMKLSLIHKDKWSINAFCERSQLYATGTPSALQAGISLGYVFESKRLLLPYGYWIGND